MVTLGASQQIAAQPSVGPARNAVRDNYVVSATDVAGIREVILDKYQKRYDEWKTEFLSTDIGKAQWEMYEHHPRLLLTITITGSNSQGAGSGEYKLKGGRVVENGQKNGGNSVGSWGDREYWGEANAMLFLRDRVEKEKFHCRLFAKIKRAVEEYAKNYEERFAEIAKEQGAIYTCGWR